LASPHLLRVRDRVPRLLAAISLIRLDDAAPERAANLEPASLRSLDAVHLASALELANDLGVVVSYDERMLSGATALGLRTAAPG
jgi:uncharacterized protein